MRGLRASGRVRAPLRVSLDSRRTAVRSPPALRPSCARRTAAVLTPPANIESKTASGDARRQVNATVRTSASRSRQRQRLDEFLRRTEANIGGPSGSGTSGFPCRAPLRAHPRTRRQLGGRPHRQRYGRWSQHAMRLGDRVFGTREMQQPQFITTAFEAAGLKGSASGPLRETGSRDTGRCAARPWPRRSRADRRRAAYVGGAATKPGPVQTSSRRLPPATRPRRAAARQLLRQRSERVRVCSDARSQPACSKS